MWVYAEARLVVLEEYLVAGRAFEAEVESQRQMVRAAHEAAGYSPESRPWEEGNPADVNRLESNSWISKAYPPRNEDGPHEGQARQDNQGVEAFRTFVNMFVNTDFCIVGVDPFEDKDIRLLL